MRKVLATLFILSYFCVSAQVIAPTWASMAENYEVPEWFRDGKVGVWFHYGVPSGIDENRPNDGSHYGRRMYGDKDFDGTVTAQSEMTRILHEWHEATYGPVEEFGYEDLVPLFKAENFDAELLVQYVKDCGARFIMPVATHHDNFDMYASSHSWNCVDMGPKRDLMQEWKDAAYKYDLKFGVSTHLYWSPRFFKDARQYQTAGTPAWDLFNMDFDPKDYPRQDSWNQHWYDRCWELIEKYDPDMFNNDSPYPDAKNGKSLGVKLFSDYINRDLAENGGKQTTVFSCKNSTLSKAAFTYNLERGSAGEMKAEPWIWATDLSGNWFYRKDAVNRMSIPVMIGNAIDAISKNGAVMLNIALRGDGTIPDNQKAYLNAFGDFLKANGEGIYGTRPWKVFGEGPLQMKDGRQGENKRDFTSNDVRFTTKDGKLYAFILAPATGNVLIKTLAKGGVLDQDIKSIKLLATNKSVDWERTENGLSIEMLENMPKQQVTGFRITLK